MFKKVKLNQKLLIKQFAFAIPCYQLIYISFFIKPKSQLSKKLIII